MDPINSSTGGSMDPINSSTGDARTILIVAGEGGGGILLRELSLVDNTKLCL